MDLTNEDVLRILKIIDESGYNDIRLEIGDLKLHVQKEGVADGSTALPFAPSHAAPVQTSPAPRPVVAAAPTPKAAALPVAQNSPVSAALAAGDVAVSAPILGIFYRASSPGEKPFVEVGQKVAPDDTLCLIEVMKLFNSVNAGVAGTVTRIVADNGKMVEQGQALFHIQPDA